MHEKTTEAVCEWCHGSGDVAAGELTCNVCGGTGKPPVKPMMSLQDAVVVGILTRDLDEIECLRGRNGDAAPPNDFLTDQLEEARAAAWKAALDAAEGVIRAKLREKGVAA